MVIKAQGEYDPEVIKNPKLASYFERPLIVSPSEILEGKRLGICRDFGFLLEWSLNKIKSPNLDAKPSFKRSQFFEKSFQVTTVVGRRYDLSRDDFSSGHLWVRVITFVKDRDGKLSQRAIDLDPTWHTDGFVPLMRRNLTPKDDKLEEMLKVCSEVEDCILDNAR